MHLRTSLSAAGLPAVSTGAWASTPVSQANALVDALVEVASRPPAEGAGSGVAHRAIVSRWLRMQGVDCRGRDAAELVSPFLPPV